MLFRETLMRRQAQVVQGSASKLDAVISAGFGMVSFLLSVIGLFFLTAFSIRYLHFTLVPVLGPQLSRLADRVPDMSTGVWLLLFAAIGFLYGFFHKQKKRFSSQEFGEFGNAASVET
jgi:hypothetical protein